MRARTGMRIGSRQVGPGHPCWIVAEAGINHNGDLRTAKRLIDAAKKAGADAVKLQSFTAERLIGRDHPWFDRFEAWSLSEAGHRALLSHARRARIPLFSTPFDTERLDLLVRLGVPAIKIGSGEITHLPLLARAGRSRLPVILSTGASTEAEIAEAVSTLRRAGCRQLALLHCVSSYPTLPGEAGLWRIRWLSETFAPEAVGFSDHTEGPEAAEIAVAAGASLIEKHFTLDRSLPGPDQRLSADPRGFRRMVEAVRRAEAMLGRSGSARTEPESMRRAIRRGLYALTDIAPGDRLSERNVAIRRPEGPLLPKRWAAVAGRRARRPVRAGAPLRAGDVGR